MMYSRGYLDRTIIQNQKDIFDRYQYKYSNDYTNFRKLKFHEKDFFFEHKELYHKCDLLDIPEAQDYLFYKLILIYAGNNGHINFRCKAQDYYGVISNELQKKYERFFWKKLESWRKELDAKHGVYLSVIAVERNKKQKDLNKKYKEGYLDIKDFIMYQDYIDVTFYFIYYNARLYFDELKVKYLIRRICGYDFQADIYTFCHVLSRHYFPMMNIPFDVSINDDIKCVDLFNLPQSLLDLVTFYSKFGLISMCTENMLFEINGYKYILWVKKKGDNTVFQLRTFYRCTKKTDLDKFITLNKYKISDSLFVFTK